MPEDKIKDLYLMVQSTGAFADENEFRNFAKDTNNFDDIFEMAQSTGAFTDKKEFDDWTSDLKKKDLPYGSEISTSPLDIAKEITTPTKTFEFGTQNTQKQPKSVAPKPFTNEAKPIGEEKFIGSTSVWGQKQQEPKAIAYEADIPEALLTEKKEPKPSQEKIKQAYELSSTGQYDQSNAVIEQEISADPNNTFLLELQSYNQTNQAADLFSQGKFTEAQNLLVNAKQNIDAANALSKQQGKPLNISTYIDGAELSLAQGDKKAAKGFIQQALYANNGQVTDDQTDIKIAKAYELAANISDNKEQQERFTQYSKSRMAMAKQKQDDENYKGWVEYLRDPNFSLHLMENIVNPTGEMRGIYEGVKRFGEGVIESTAGVIDLASGLSGEAAANNEEFSLKQFGKQQLKAALDITIGAGHIYFSASMLMQWGTAPYIPAAFTVANAVTPEISQKVMMLATTVAKDVYGKDVEQFSDIQKGFLELGDIVGMLVLFEGAKTGVKYVGKKTGEITIGDQTVMSKLGGISKKIFNKEPLTDTEVKTTTEILDKSTDENIVEAAKATIVSKDQAAAGKIEVPKEEVKPIENKPVETTGGEKVEGNDIKIPDEDIKQKQFDIITETNPPKDDIHTAIRSKEEILTPEEAFKDDSGTPDWGKKEKDEALALGVVKIYSSKPIENGAFVTPSEMEAKNYAGNGKVYSKEVSVKDVAWIDGLQGQYAKIEKIKTEPTVKVAETVAETPKTENVAPEALKDVKETGNALSVISKNRNKLGDNNPKYFFPDVQNNKYLTWDQFKKQNKKTDENTLREHWNEITGEYPESATTELKSKMDYEQEVHDKLNFEYKEPAMIAEEYHKAKLDGSNPELVKAVEDLLGKKEVSNDIPATTKAEPVEPVVETATEKPFSKIENIVSESKSLDEAFKKAQEIKDVPAEESKAFREKYDPENNLTPKQAFEKFYNEVKGEKVEIPKETVKETPKEISKKKLDDAREKFRKAGGLSMGGLETLPEFVELIRAYVDYGIKSAQEFIKEFRKDYPELNDKIDDKALTNKYEETIGKKERQFYTKVQEHPDISAEVKEALSTNEKARYYIPTTNEINSAEARAIIDAKGLDLAMTDAVNMSNNMHPASRTLLRGMLIKEFDLLGVEAAKSGNTKLADSYFEKAEYIVEERAKRGTELGQELQAYNDFVSPERAVYKARKMVKKSRDKKIEKSRGKIDRIKKAVEDVNKEVADEITGSKSVKDKVSKVSDKQRRYADASKRLADNIRRNKIIKDKDKDIVFMQVIPFQREIWNGAVEIVAKSIETTGKIADAVVLGVNHIKGSDWYKNLDAEQKDRAVKRFEKEFEQEKKKEPKLSEKQPSEKLADRIIKRVEAQKKGKFDPVAEMVNTLFKKVDEKLKKSEKPEKKSDVEKLKSAIENKDEYAKTWEESKRIVDEKIDELNISDIEKEAMLNELQAYYDEIIGKPYSKKMVSGAENEVGANTIQYWVDKVEKNGFDIKDIRDDIVEKIIYETGAKESDANTLASQIISDIQERVNAAREKNKAKLDAAQKRIEQREAELNQQKEEFNRKGKNKPVWGVRKKQAADNLVKKLDNTFDSEAKNNTALQEFSNRVKSVLTSRAKELNPAADIKNTSNPIDVLKEVFGNRDKYNDVINDARDAIKEKFKDNPEELAKIDNYLGQISDKPFSEQLLSSVIRVGIKELDIKINDVIRSHYTVYDATKRSLQEKLVDELGLSGADAAEIATEVGRMFDTLATKKKLDALNTKLSIKDKAEAKVNPKQTRQLYDTIIELSNLGALSDGKYVELFAEKMGLPKLTVEQTSEIYRLAQRVQTAAEGMPKRMATEDLLKYYSKIPGIDWGDVTMAVWYSNVLSGYKTQGKNIVANAENTAGELIVKTIRYAVSNPSMIPQLFTGLITGYKIGAVEAINIFKSGYTPVKYSKVDMPNVLEVWKFKGGAFNPANYYKYVTRFMMAADAFSYRGLAEMRSYGFATKIARNEGKTNGIISTYKKANEILYGDETALKIARQTATDEGFKGLYHTQRVYELMRSQRPKDMIEDANNFAAKGTFNHDTEGTLGVLTDMVGNATNAVNIKVNFRNKSFSVKPLKFVVPFTRIIANVTNTALDYTPIGFYRAAKGSRGFSGFEGNRFSQGKYKVLTADQRIDLVTKATIGLAAQTSLFYLTQEDENGESAIRITANGTGDYVKNRELRDAGWQPYSIKVGKTWVSYQYTPLFLALAPIGFWRDTEKYNKESFKDKTWAAKYAYCNFKLISVFSDMSFVSSVANLMTAMTSPREDAFVKYVERLNESTIKSFIKPNLYSQVSKDVMAFMDLPEKETQGIVGALLKDVPIARDSYNNSVNCLGQEVVPNTSIFIKTDKEDDVYDFIANNQLWIGKPTQNAKSSQIWDSKNEVFRPMDDDEYYKFIVNRGNYILNGIGDGDGGKLTGLNTLMLKKYTTEKEKHTLESDVDKLKTAATRKAKEEIEKMILAAPKTINGIK